MSSLTAEFVGTAILIVLGDGVVANVVLNKSKGQNSGWIVITTGWALAVFVAVYATARISGAHLNPAVSVGLAVTGAFPWADVPGYIAAQMLGAIAGSVLVWLAYLPHWRETEDADSKRAVFCTAPAIRHPVMNFLCEFIATFVFIFGVLTIKTAYEDPISGSTVPINMGALGAIPVALLVWAIGLSLGGPTGYAINPARDLGPRIAHAILPIAGKTHSDWGYAWVPILGPLAGASVAALLYIALGKY